MTTETMTAEDAEWANESGLAINNLPSAPPCITERILATYAENTRLREENERLTVRLDETTKVAAHLLCEDEKLRARLAEVEQDAERWQDYAIHLAHCRECGTSNLHCVRGQAFRDACFDNKPHAALSRPTGDKE